MLGWKVLITFIIIKYCNNSNIYCSYRKLIWELK
ncbi:MAG: hypothetical protein ACNI3H_11900 [Halarcobacter ebronensis]